MAELTRKEVASNLVRIIERNIADLEGLVPSSVPDGNPFYDDGGVVPFDEVKKRYIATVLRESGFNVSKAAQLSGLVQATLYRKIKSYGIRLPRKISGSNDGSGSSS